MEKGPEENAESCLSADAVGCMDSWAADVLEEIQGSLSSRYSQRSFRQSPRLPCSTGLCGAGGGQMFVLKPLPKYFTFQTL